MLTNFENPGPEYRAKPFWAWNGKLEKDELIRQIDVMEEMGFGGFFMHSRTGLQTEYLGGQWFDLINACADYAEKKNLEAWLYDEDRWPSGLAGGLVTKGHPEYWMKAVRLEILPAGSRPDGEILAAFSCVLEEGNCLKEYVTLSETPPENHNAVLVFREILTDAHPVYNGAGYLDTMDREAVRRYIEITHEAYKERCGDRLGKSIRGIFTDEPHRGTLMDFFGSSNGGDNYRIPWTPALPGEMRKRFGYDLIPRLPELYLKLNGESLSSVKRDYVELCQQLFLENFMEPINRWCRENDIILTGHVLHEDCLTAQTVMNGSMIRNYEHMDYPGVDVLSGYNFNYWIVKQISSACRQLGRPWILSEMYGCSGWHMKLEDYKRSGDWQALFGVNLRCPHLSWYTMEGECKRDYPASIFFQSAWYREYKELEDYYARIALVMSQGSAVCSLLVVSPLESVWSQIGLGYAKNLSPAAPEIREIEERYQQLFRWLAGSQIDFDYGDEDFLLRMGEVDVKSLKIGETRYDTVLVSGMVTMRESTRKLLESFANAGGKVIFAGDKPGYIDASPMETPIDFGENIPFERESVIAAAGNPLLKLEGGNSDKIFAQMREDGNLRYLMLLSTDPDQEISVTATMPQGEITLLNCRTGSTEILSNEGKIELFFSPGEEKLLQIDTSATPSKTARPSVSGEAVSLGEPIAYRLDEPNVCVLDMAKLSINGGAWSEQEEVLLLDRKLRDAAGLPWRGGDMLQPWYQKKHAADMSGNSLSFALEFTFRAEWLPQTAVNLAVEHPEAVTVEINGVKLEKFNGWWADPCLKMLELPHNTLKIGENIVTVSGNYRFDSGLEAMFLLGEFGVRLDGETPKKDGWDYSRGARHVAGGVCLKGNNATIIPLPERLTLGSLADQGLPFYSGKVAYQFAVPENTGKGRLSLKEFGASCVNIIVDNQKIGGFWAAPYEIDLEINRNTGLWLEAVLTRRNSFGPLHALPVIPFACGPESFLKHDTGGYGLLCNGLTSAPCFRSY